MCGKWAHLYFPVLDMHILILNQNHKNPASHDNNVVTARFRVHPNEWNMILIV